MFSKESEEERRKEFLTPDYSNVKPDDEEDEDDDDLDDIDDIEDDDPEEEEKVLEIRESLPEVQDDLPFKTTQSEQSSQPQQSYSRSFFNQPQKPMGTTWPSSSSGGNSFWGGGNMNNQQPSWGNSGISQGWGQKPSPIWGNPSQGNTPWGQGASQTQGQETLDRKKKVIICDVLDCLICTLEGPQKTGLIPRDIWDISPRFDVWSALKRFGYIERIYPTIPRSLITNSSGDENWIKLLNYISAALASFLRIPTDSVQILTQSFISQPKVEVIGSVINGLPKEEIVYIGTQSGYQFQNSSDIDCATELGIDYIDLGKFLTIYS